MKIVIVGAGGHGRVVLDILRNNHQFEVVGFLDSNPALHNNFVDGIEVFGDLSALGRAHEFGFRGAVIAIGDNRIRQAYAETVEKSGIGLVSAIHPTATIADTATIGKNVVIAAGAKVCTHVSIEDSAICNTGCIIDHESHIGKAVHICPGVRMAGHVNVQQAAFIGIGATVIQNITIGEAAVIGAGAVVIGDVAAYSTVVGVPAKVVKHSHLTVSDRTHLDNHVRKIEQPTVTRPVRKRPPLMQDLILTK
ncbi:MAG: acetyltransferase [Sedimentisphaerales bacterium]|nr:acetyltransferase [Sedimentisphaerales bacterium]